MTFRFLHLADLHLDTHFGGRPLAKERLRAATSEAFRRAVDFALEERLHAVLVAGDLFDDPCLSLHTELELARAVQRLAEAGIAFVWTCGNHDPGGKTKRASGLALDRATEDEPWRERVRVFRGPQPERFIVKDASGAPVGVVVGAGHSTDREDKNLAADFPRLATDLPVVGLLHTQVESALSAEHHDRFAPSSPADFERQGYAYWALGHVHVRQRAVPDLPVWYAGNLQGRNPRETGAKGGLLVEAEPGVPAEPVFVPFAPVRWETLALSELEGVDTAAALADLVEARIAKLQGTVDEELAVRLELTGPCPLAARLKRAGELDAFEEEAIERTGVVEVQLRTRGLRVPYDLADLLESPSVLSKAFELAAGARDDDRLLERLAPAVLAGLPADADEPERRAYLRDLLAGIEDELVERCLGKEPT